MWSAIKEFFRRKDRTIVATFIVGNTSIFKDGIPYVRVYTCFENELGKRWIRSNRIGPTDAHLETILDCWKYGYLTFDHIPSYWDVDHGNVPPYGHGHDHYHEVFDLYSPRMR